MMTANRELLTWIAGQIDHSSFRACYGREDEHIEVIIIVSPKHSLAEAALVILEDANWAPTLGRAKSVGVELILPDISTVRAALTDETGPKAAAARAVRRFVSARADAEVRAFYSPPFYFVQFTGGQWE